MVDKHQEDRYNLEARFAVDNALSDCELVYFGRNKTTRIPDSESLQREMEMIEQITQQVSRITYKQALDRVERAGRGYKISRLAEPNDQDIETLFRLYQEAYAKYTFEITRSTVKEMISNGNIVIVARDNTRSIVSSMIAEHCTIPLQGHASVELYELSDYATLRSDRGNGLMTAMQLKQ